MKQLSPILFTAILFLASCTSQKKLAYLSNLPDPNGEDTFTMEVPDYKLHTRDVLYITIKAMTPDGTITDFLSSSNGAVTTFTQGDASGYLYGYEVNPEGNIILPAIGQIRVIGLTLDETRRLLQEKSVEVFKNSTVECKLLSFKFTVIGEAKSPGAYVNYNNYLTVIEAVGRAGGVSDYGKRDRVLVVRQLEQGTRTYRINLQDKNVISSDAYFLLPNDVVIIEPTKQKVFNQNLPAFSFFLTITLSTITTTLLLINYFGN